MGSTWLGSTGLATTNCSFPGSEMSKSYLLPPKSDSLVSLPTKSTEITGRFVSPPYVCRIRLDTRLEGGAVYTNRVICKIRASKINSTVPPYCLVSDIVSKYASHDVVGLLC
jgi:hypothetical protein